MMSLVVPAVILALTPLIWRLAAEAPALLAPIPLLAIWLIALADFERSRRSVSLVVAGVALGLGVYVSAPSVVMMPVFAAITIVVAYQAQVELWGLSVFAAAFAVSAAPLAVSWMLHPDHYRQLVLSHHLYDANRFNVLQGIREVTSWVGLTARSEVYWDYLNPAFLFISGRVLAWPLVVVLPIGACRILAGSVPLVDRVALAGLFASPIAAALTAEAPIAARSVWITPFAAMVSAVGIYVLMNWWRARTSGAAAPSPPASR